ncbi:ceramide-1-phosphate transfer protein-like isoform X2 [Tubulanus polymorphus]|uniref:ceramide-1-phosphate transfer protein-like isoform X2 n=1 Tax=Tubulanus polymorphus TaxID=672921 RepID=UPI003DA4D6D4
MAANNEGAFDIQAITDNFKACRLDDNILQIDEYVEAYSELSRIFPLLGKVFGFVSSDVHSKIHILREHRKSSMGEHYATIQGMIAYEVENNLTECKINKLDNGSRTLLRLHRALDFITKFLHEVHKAEDNASTGAIASDVYTETLAKFHPYLVRKAVQLATYMLPDKKGLVAKMKKYDYEKTIEILKQFDDAVKPVYETTQSLYTERAAIFQ